VKSQSNRGSFYLNTRTDRVIEGTWSSGTPEEPGRVECVLSAQAPDREPGGFKGFFHPRDGSSVPGTWEELRSFEPGIDPAEADAWLVDVSRYSVLEWMEPFDSIRDNVVLDLREHDRPELYHTMTVRGWLQETAEAPTAYHPYRAPSGKTGQGPVFMLVHGFTGDPINWEPVRRRLENGPWPYVVPLLPGHGQSRNRLAETHWTEWRDVVRHLAVHLRDHGHDVVGLGLSMGGLLLLDNARLFDAVVCVNSPWSLHDWRAPLLPLIKQFKEYHFSGEGGKVIPVEAIHQLKKLIGSVKGSLGSIEIPAYFLNNRDDEVIPPEDGDRYADRLRHASRDCLDSGGHESPANPDVAKTLMNRVGNWLDREGFDIPAVSRL
jgi:carboxylesterase